MRKIFMLFACAVLMGTVLTACGDDDEVVASRGMDYEVAGQLKMAVEMTTPAGVQSVDCGTVNDKVSVKSTDDNLVAAVTLGGFTTPPIVQHNDMVISMTDISLKGLKLQSLGNGNYSINQTFEDVAVERCDFGMGQPMQNLAIGGEVCGEVSDSGSVSLKVRITKMGSMPYTLVLSFSN